MLKNLPLHKIPFLFKHSYNLNSKCIATASNSLCIIFSEISPYIKPPDKSDNFSLCSCSGTLYALRLIKRKLSIFFSRVICSSHGYAMYAYIIPAVPISGE